MFFDLCAIKMVTAPGAPRLRRDANPPRSSLVSPHRFGSRFPRVMATATATATATAAKTAHGDAAAIRTKG